MNVVVNRWHDTPSDARCQNPVVRVGDAEGTSIRDETGELFRKEEKKTVVETLGGRLSPKKSFQDVPEDGRCEIRSSAPGGKGDAVRTRRRVV